VNLKEEPSKACGNTSDECGIRSCEYTIHDPELHSSDARCLHHAFPGSQSHRLRAIFLTLTRRYPSSDQQLLARKIAADSFAILAVSLLFGTSILGFFGISLVVIQIAGGLLLASTGFNLLNRKDPHLRKRKRP